MIIPDFGMIKADCLTDGKLQLPGLDGRNLPKKG